MKKVKVRHLRGQDISNKEDEATKRAKAVKTGSRQESVSWQARNNVENKMHLESLLFSFCENFLL